MDGYQADGQITVVTPVPGDTALAVIASTLTRAKLDFFEVSTGGNVADNIIQWLVRRISVAGTSTLVTPVPDDPGAPVAQLSAQEEYAAEPTFTVELFDFLLHQRSIYQWNAKPGAEKVIPATAAAGIGFTPIHAAFAGVAKVVCHWVE